MGTLLATRKTALVSNAVWYSLLGNGCPNDADISFGSTSLGTDATAFIQAAINAGYRIWWDVKCSVTGLKTPNNTVIDGPKNCGVILRSFSNCAIFQNSNWNDANHTWNPNLVDSLFINDNIRINNIIINHNARNANGYQQVHSSTATGWCSPIRMYCATRVNLDGVTVLNPRTFSAHFVNSKYIQITKARTDAGPNPYINTDGWHFTNSNSDIYIADCFSRCGDDHVSFCADDGVNYSVHNGNGDYTPANNNNCTYYTGAAGVGILRAVVRRQTLEGGIFGIRALSAGSRLDLDLSGLYGFTNGLAGIFDNLWQQPESIYATGGGKFGIILVDDVQVSVGNSGVGYINESFFNINASGSFFRFSNINRTDYSTNSRPTILVSGVNTYVGELQVNDYFANESGATNTTTPQVLIKDATVGRLKSENVSVGRENSANDSPIYAIVGKANVRKIQLNNIAASNMLNILIHNSSGSVNSIVATNVDHTGQGSGGSFKTISSIADIYVSAFSSNGTLTSGTFTSTRGDAFGSTAASNNPPATSRPSGTVVSTYYADDPGYTYPADWVRYERPSGNTTASIGSVVMYILDKPFITAKRSITFTQPGYLKHYGNKSASYGAGLVYLNGQALSPGFNNHADSTTDADPVNPNWVSSLIQPGTYTFELGLTDAKGQIVLDTLKQVDA